MSEFKREPRYIVFKLTDVRKYLTQGEIDSLMCIGDKISVCRSDDGKPPFNAVVVEQDWPEFEPTWDAIEERVTGSTPAPNAPDFADAYQGAMEEVAIWKKRALEAEEMTRKFIAEINGPTHMGEPVATPPSVPEITDEMVSAYLVEQAATVQAVDDMWGSGGKAPSHMYPVREACRAGLKAALLAAAPKPGEPT